MRKILSYAMCIVLCMAMLSGCGKKVEEEGTLVGVIFERGHGSAWGNQFYMEVCEDEIIQANYISEDSADLVTEEHIAITSEQWQEICDVIEKMELEKVKSSAWKEQLGVDILDGGAYHELSLIWKTEKGEKSVAYHWPEDEAGAALEQLLEQLLERETLSGSEQVEEKEIDPDTIIEVEEETEDIDITSDNTYWVADIGRTEDAGSGELIVLEPDLWAVDLLMRFDGTAQFRDVHEGVCLIDDSYLNLTWERTPEGKYLFYSAIVEGPVFIAEYDDGELIVEYLGMNFYMEQEAVPQSAGQMQIPAELDGTWLMVSGENEGYQWEAMPGELSSLVIGVTSIDGPLVLAADMETRDYYGDLMDSAYGLEVEVLDEPLYAECGNDAWSVRIGAMAEEDENGYPVETEYYATLLDYNTLLLQQYYTLDGSPSVSNQTYVRFPDLVSWQSYEAMDLNSSNWVCYDYVGIDGEPAPMPEEVDHLSIMLSEDQSCQIVYGDGTTAEGSWQLENGGVILLRSNEEAESEFWLGGAVSGYYIETAADSIEAYDMALYYNGGIMKLVMNRHG
ncbi:MAG: hypothetical protein IJN10_07515 [Firmicutes bacterium]|nr:hypothetical protein [Bacillota bacterium]